MDEIASVDYIGPWEIENITDDCMLYRQAHNMQTIGNKKRRLPNETHFALRMDEIYLSFNWNKYLDPERNFKLIGISFSKKLDWLNPKEFSIFQYPVGFLRSLDQVKIVAHDPVFDEECIPSPVGKPNNRAHSAVYCIENDLKFRAIMTDYCEDNYDYIKCEVDKNKLAEEIEALRQRANNTPFHKEWQFDT